tara:strand:+ start:372 stop:791 length:420 start_codon:yes stop_codon:yes gene_type:complete
MENELNTINDHMTEITENINLDLDINYTNDDEYKQCLIKVFNVNKSNLIMIDSEDDPNDTFMVMVNKITLLKKNLERNQEIIKLSNLSAKMLLVEDLEIGLMILHSYDYFELFYQLYCHLLKTNEIKKDVYEKLLEKIK